MIGQQANRLSIEGGGTSRVPPRVRDYELRMRLRLFKACLSHVLHYYFKACLTCSLQTDVEMLSRVIRGTSSKLLQLSRLAETSSHQCRVFSTDPAEHFHYSRVVFGSLTKSFVTGSLRAEEPKEPIDLQKAIRDHEHYIREVKKLVPNTVQIAPDEEFPDLVYVEDPAVVHEGKALITNMIQPTRANEVRLMRPVLEELGIEIIEVDDPEAVIDGGDVMFTGREFLVGLSRRTNKVSFIPCPYLSCSDWASYFRLG